MSPRDGFEQTCTPKMCGKALTCCLRQEGHTICPQPCTATHANLISVECMSSGYLGRAKGLCCCHAPSRL